MIETPAAALISESIAKTVTLAIGTNDLTMYTLAIDRGDEEVAKIYDPAHLSVLRLIKLSAESAKGWSSHKCLRRNGRRYNFYTFVIRYGNQKVINEYFKNFESKAVY